MDDEKFNWDIILNFIQILGIKKDNDFYDPEENLDMMFPDRYDDDFDEDSMSYDSAFGDD